MLGAVKVEASVGKGRALALAFTPGTFALDVAAKPTEGSNLVTRVALVAGFWGQNIGNAFFNLGGRAVLRSAGFEVFLFQDQPAYWTFRNEGKGNYPNAFPAIELLDVDCVVLQGPLFTRNFGRIWIQTLERLAARGIGWAVLGGAFRAYTPQERAVAREVFERFPPRFVSTRDEPTWCGLRGAVRRLNSGVDSAFFTPEAYEPPKLNAEYVTFAFDHFGEPSLAADPKGPITIGGERFRLSHDRLGDWAALRSKGHAILAAAVRRRDRLPRSVAGRSIVRPDHRTNPHLPLKIYRDSGGIASDEPWTYLALYARTELTFSDRVHACVATLAYGRPAMLHNPSTKRSALFSAAGVAGIESAPKTLVEDERRRSFESIGNFVRDSL